MGDPNHPREDEVIGSEYYVERLHNVPNLIDDCCHLINKEWKRSHSARLRSIEGSSENFPMSLILLKNSKKPEVIGHCKISKLFLSNTKVFVETVVIHPSLRGKGLGKFLMKEAEEVCKSKNIEQIYLATKGQEGFYEKLGYIKCPPVSIYGCHVNDSNENIRKTENESRPIINMNVENKSTPAPPAPPMPKNRDSNNAFSIEIKKDKKPRKVAVGYVNFFGTIVEVKQVGSNDYLYQVDDGTGVIACKHSTRQFEEIVSAIENEQMVILNKLSESQQSFEQSSIIDHSADDSVFNERSMQIEEINVIKKSKLKGLLTIWDDIYKSFNSLFEPYDIGDFVLIQGKLYTYFKVNQIYINKIRAVDLMEEIMLTSAKLEDSFQLSKETPTSKAQSDSEKRLSGLITFDNIPHLNANISIPRNIEAPNITSSGDNSCDIVTPNLETTITFDTFTGSS